MMKPNEAVRLEHMEGLEFEDIYMYLRLANTELFRVLSIVLRPVATPEGVIIKPCCVVWSGLAVPPWSASDWKTAENVNFMDDIIEYAMNADEDQIDAADLKRESEM